MQPASVCYPVHFCLNISKKAGPATLLLGKDRATVLQFEPGSFDDVVKGADFVYHTASNVIFDSPNPERDLIDPAVKGTDNVLRCEWFDMSAYSAAGRTASHAMSACIQLKQLTALLVLKWKIISGSCGSSLNSLRS